MDVSSINSDLIRGNATTIILKALLVEDRYGYDILREIEVKSAGQYKLKQPTLYSCLKRLEKQGLISSYWGDESDTEGGRRRYYSLTDAGRSYLEKMQSEYEYSRTILDKLLSEEDFDFQNKEAPFDINGLRPYTKRKSDEDEAAEPVVKIVYVNAETNEPINAKAVDESIIHKIETPAPTDDVSKTAEVKPSQTFEPLSKEGSSFDNKYRHSSRSVLDIVGQINDILGKKPEDVAAETPVDDKVEEVTEALPEETVEVEEDITPVEKLILDKTAVEDEYYEEEIDEEAARIKRENAKRALGIGNFGNSKIDLDKFDEAQKKSEILDDSEELSEDSPKKFDLFSPIPINQQLNPEKYSTPINNPVIDETLSAPKLSAYDLFDKYKKKDETPVDDTPKVDPRDLFDKYKQNEEPVADTPKVDPRELFDKYKKKEEPVEVKTEPKKVLIDKSPVPPASTFSFRKDDKSVVNYRDAFSDLRKTDVSTEEVKSDDGIVTQKAASNIDLKTKLFAEGYKLRPYTRENTENYYSLNYIKKNKINRDCYAIMFVLILFEVLVGWLIFRDKFTTMAYLTVCILAMLVPAIPFVIYSLNPEKRVRANYNFRTSVLNRLMLYLNLLVIVCLIGFFGIGADINNGSTMIGPILVPALLLLNLPFSSFVYLLLYNTKKYHIS